MVRLRAHEVQITVIGIDVPSEQDEIFLRRLAETNHGDYKSKALQQQSAVSASQAFADEYLRRFQAMTFRVVIHRSFSTIQ